MLPTQTNLIDGERCAAAGGTTICVVDPRPVRN